MTDFLKECHFLWDGQSAQPHPHPQSQPQPLRFLRIKLMTIPMTIAKSTAPTSRFPQFALSHSIAVVSD